MTTLIPIDSIADWDIDSKKHVLPVVNDLLQFLPLLQGRPLNVLDVGSNTGKFIELLMEHATISDAILIEPILELMTYSQSKFPHFKFENRLIHKDTRSSFLFTPHGNENLGLSRVIGGYTDAEAVCVRHMETISLSTLLSEIYPDFKPDIIKIDAEGVDIPIVEGLVDYIKSNPDNLPIIIYECSSNTSANDIVAIYIELGYERWCRMPDDCSRDEFLIPKIVLAR